MEATPRQTTQENVPSAFFGSQLAVGVGPSADLRILSKIPLLFCCPLGMNSAVISYSFSAKARFAMLATKSCEKPAVLPYAGFTDSMHVEVPTALMHFLSSTSH